MPCTWEDNQINDISGQHFNSNGTAVGVEFTIDGAGSQIQSDVQATEDRRFFSTWVEDGEVGIEFYDTRDNANTTPAYSNGQSVGTVDTINGGIGNDLLTGGGDFDR